MSDYMLIIVLDQRTAFRAFIQLLRSRKQDPRRVVHALVGQRAFSLGYDLPGMKGTAGRFGCYADESGRNLPAYIAYIRTAEVDALVSRKNGGVNGAKLAAYSESSSAYSGFSASCMASIISASIAGTDNSSA